MIQSSWCPRNPPSGPLPLSGNNLNDRSEVLSRPLVEPFVEEAVNMEWYFVLHFLRQHKKSSLPQGPRVIEQSDMDWRLVSLALPSCQQDLYRAANTSPVYPHPWHDVSGKAVQTSTCKKPCTTDDCYCELERIKLTGITLHLFFPLYLKRPLFLQHKTIHSLKCQHLIQTWQKYNKSDKMLIFV